MCKRLFFSKSSFASLLPILSLLNTHIQLNSVSCPSSTYMYVHTDSFHSSLIACQFELQLPVESHASNSTSPLSFTSSFSPPSSPITSAKRQMVRSTDLTCSSATIEQQCSSRSRELNHVRKLEPHYVSGCLLNCMCHGLFFPGKRRQIESGTRNWLPSGVTGAEGWFFKSISFLANCYLSQNTGSLLGCILGKKD